MVPIVSIITASFNKEKYISDTINSVLNQTFNNWELIIIDDLSNDKTVSIIEEFVSKDSRIKYIAQSQNTGANYCRNEGVNLALGKYIVFLDADDILMPHCLKSRTLEMDQNNVDFCVFTMGIFNKIIGDSAYLWIPNSKNPLNDFLQHKLPWSILQPIWKKEFLKNLGGFDLDFKRLQDVELHTRALFHEKVTYKLIVQKPDCYYRIDEERKNYNPYEFLKRRIESSNLYYRKFYRSGSKIQKTSYLNGTIYSTFLQVLNNYKIGNISRSQFTELEKEIFSEVVVKNLGNKMLFVKFGRYLSLSPFRIPGINYLLTKVLVF